MSALGACRTESTAEGATREVPVAKRPLLSFGLEDPFIWLAQRGDSLRLARLQSHATNLQPWYLHLLCSGLPKRLYREHTRLSALYPESHPFNAELRTIRRPLLKVFASASAIAYALCCCRCVGVLGVGMYICRQAPIEQDSAGNSTA